MSLSAATHTSVVCTYLFVAMPVRVGQVVDSVGIVDTEQLNVFPTDTRP